MQQLTMHTLTAPADNELAKDMALFDLERSARTLMELASNDNDRNVLADVLAKLERIEG